MGWLTHGLACIRRSIAVYFCGVQAQMQSTFVEVRVWLCLAPHAESFCSLRMAGKVSTAINLTTNVIMLEDIDEVLEVRWRQ